MHPTRTLPRFIVGLLLGLALLAVHVQSAEAAPSTDERRVAAEDVASKVCRSVPVIPKLPSTVNANKLCRSVIVENVDPDGTNGGIRAACQIGLPGRARAAVPFCTQVMNQLLNPARKLFLDTVVPATQKLACVTTAPAAFDCLTQQVHVWLEHAIVTLWQGLLSVLTSDTEMIKLLDGWHNSGVVSLYSDIGSVGATLLLGVLLTSFIISAIRFDFRQFGHTFLGVIVWGIFWSGGVSLAVLLLKASDEVSKWLAGRPDSSGTTDLDRAGKHFASWVEYITSVSSSLPVRPTYDPGSFTAILICLLLIIAVVATLVALLMRNVALLMIVMALPLSLAGAAGTRLTREWFNSAVRLFVSLLLAKPLIVIAVRLGSVMVTVPNAGEKQATFSDALLGVTIILLAALLPGVVYRFSAGMMNTQAGSAPRASGGFSGQTAQSVQSGMDTTRMVMERNAPRPALVAGPSTGGTAITGGSRAAVSGAASGAGGSAAGPIGLVALGAVLAAGALESSGRWLAGHAATGGGVLGDVDGPHVPTPPISRNPYLRSGGQGQPSQPNQRHQASTHQAGPKPETAQITVIRRTPTPSHHPAVGSEPGHLIIPGSVVSDHRPELPSAPKALPSREGRP